MAKDFSKLGKAFANGDDDDPLVSQQEALLTSSLDNMREREIERLKNKASQLGLVLGGDDSGEVQRLREEIAVLHSQLANAPTQQGALVQVQNGIRQLGRFTLTRNSLIAPDNVSEDELTVMAEFIRDVNGSLQFWGGDLANIYINVYGVQAEPTVWLAEFFGVALKTLQEWANVCRIFSISARAENLNFTHHREVYYVPDELQNNRLNILQYASENNMSVRDLQTYIKSLLPPKQLPKGGLDTLLSKERAPNLGSLRKLMSGARSGDRKAQTALKKEIDSYRQWLKELAESAGIE